MRWQCKVVLYHISELGSYQLLPILLAIAIAPSTGFHRHHSAHNWKTASNSSLHHKCPLYECVNVQKEFDCHIENLHLGKLLCIAYLSSSSWPGGVQLIANCGHKVASGIMNNRVCELWFFFTTSCLKIQNEIIF